MGSPGWWSRWRTGRSVGNPLPRARVDLPGLGPTPIAQSVDCLGAMCPRPQLLTMKVLGKMQNGEVIEVRCDSAPAVEGFPALALSLTSTHLATIRDADGWRVYLRKGQ
jgi:TusA-related sulfurtransferase